MILSRLHKGTNNRLAYYGKNLVRYITPKVLLRNRLQKVLAELEKRPDKEYILRRVDYYNKMQGIVPIDPVSSHRLADKVVQRFPVLELCVRGCDAGSGSTLDRQKPSDSWRKYQFGDPEHGKSAAFQFHYRPDPVPGQNG